jgi:hypothetical protein
VGDLWGDFRGEEGDLRGDLRGEDGLAGEFGERGVLQN